MRSHLLNIANKLSLSINVICRHGVLKVFPVFHVFRAWFSRFIIGQNLNWFHALSSQVYFIDITEISTHQLTQNFTFEHIQMMIWIYTTQCNVLHTIINNKTTDRKVNYKAFEVMYLEKRRYASNTSSVFKLYVTKML